MSAIITSHDMQQAPGQRLGDALEHGGMQLPDKNGAVPSWDGLVSQALAFYFASYAGILAYDDQPAESRGQRASVVVKLEHLADRFGDSGCASALPCFLLTSL